MHRIDPDEIRRLVKRHRKSDVARILGCSREYVGRVVSDLALTAYDPRCDVGGCATRVYGEDTRCSFHQRRTKLYGDPLGVRSLTHGAAGYARKCRCDKCREAFLDYRRRWRANMDPANIPHGTIGGYRNYLCRCVECKAVAAAVRRVRSAAHG